MRVGYIMTCEGKCSAKVRIVRVNRDALWQPFVGARPSPTSLPMNHSQERHSTYPNGAEAFFLVVALFGLEYLVAAAFRDAGYFRTYDPGDLSAVIRLAGNGLLFSGLLAYKRLTYRSL